MTMAGEGHGLVDLGGTDPPSTGTRKGDGPPARQARDRGQLIVRGPPRPDKRACIAGYVAGERRLLASIVPASPPGSAGPADPPTRQGPDRRGRRPTRTEIPGRPPQSPRRSWLGREDLPPVATRLVRTVPDGPRDRLDSL